MKYTFYFIFFITNLFAFRLVAQISESHLQKAQQYLKEEAYSQALLELNEVIKEDVKSAKAYFLKGLAEYKLDNPTAALYNFDLAIVYDPQYLEAYYNRGLIQAGMQSYDLAVKDYDKILSFNPEITPVYFQRGLSFLSLLKYDEAEKDFLKVTQLTPQNKNAYYQLALLQDRKEATSASMLEYLQKAISIDPQYENAIALRAKIYRKDKMAKELKQDATQLIKMNPYNWEAYLMRAEAGLILQDYEAARQDVQKIIQKQSENAEAFFCLGNIEKADNHSKLACQNWQKAADLGHQEAKEKLAEECQ